MLTDLLRDAVQAELEAGRTTQSELCRRTEGRLSRFGLNHFLRGRSGLSLDSADALLDGLGVKLALRKTQRRRQSVSQN